MTKTIRILAALAFGVLFSAASASAAMVQFTASLKGEKERPDPVTTDAEGLALLVLDTETSEFTLTVLAEDIDLAELTNAHIHRGGPEETGPPIVDLFTPTSFNQIAGVLFTQKEGTFPAAELDNLLAGNTYINLHSMDYPGGEIRGQLVPEPATLALLGVGVVAGLVRRRRG